MRKLVYTVFLFVLASACGTKPESKPYSWDDDFAPASAYRLLPDGITGEGLYQEVPSRCHR